MKTLTPPKEDNPHHETIQWGRQQLTSLGYTLKNDQPEHVLDTPWSYIVRFQTKHGAIYLKKTPPLLALEARIIKILSDQFHVSVAEVIAESHQFNCFLMKDAGRSLREILKEKCDAAGIELFCKAISQFTSMQCTVADHLEPFLDIGVPDMRLDKLPGLYMQLLAKKETLIKDGLSEKEIETLKALQPSITSLCQRLSDYGIKESIVQPDFNDNNTLIDPVNGKITIIDLGEISISHPFFSYLNCLHVAKKHHTLTESDEAYARLKTACLEKHLATGLKNGAQNDLPNDPGHDSALLSKKDLAEALNIAKRLFFIYGALCSDRLQVACDKAKFIASFKRHGRLAPSLREFINHT